MCDFLLIHTSLNEGFAALTKGNGVVACDFNREPREHGAWLHEAIDRILKNNGVQIGDLSAIAVTGGPGSYTGIRVGLSAAKGIAYAAGKQVIVCSNLAVLAWQKIEESACRDLLYIPLIHARKEEFYAGFYNRDLIPERPDQIIDLQKDINGKNDSALKKMYFGIGVEEEAFSDTDVFFDSKNITIRPEGLNHVAKAMFTRGLAYSAADATALYLKEAYITKRDKLHI